MPGEIKEIFTDDTIIELVKSKLPKLFKLANVESSRDGKIGMEVGSIRERILIALLIYKFGNENITTNIPITEPEMDVKVFGEPISIKTVTGSGGVKLIWTVDAIKAKEFCDNYEPGCDIFIAQIFWGTEGGGLFLIPISAQEEILNSMGKESYFKLPKAGTNPRGVELSKDALAKLLEHGETKKITVDWSIAEDVDYDCYKRWIDYWSE